MFGHKYPVQITKVYNQIVQVIKVVPHALSNKKESFEIYVNGKTFEYKSQSELNNKIRPDVLTTIN